MAVDIFSTCLVAPTSSATRCVYRSPGELKLNSVSIQDIDGSAKGEQKVMVEYSSHAVCAAFKPHSNE